MHRALQRQLKRTLGIADEATLAVHLAELETLAARPEMPEALAGVLRGLREFVGRVDVAYDQYDRDLELRTRSLELSSRELSDANERLRGELASRNRAIKSLRETAAGLLAAEIGTAGEAREMAALDENDLESLSVLMARLIETREAERRELDNQKFALDQHAIVSVTDTAGVILYANDRFCEISGFSRAELIGQNHRVIRSNLHPPELYADMWATISSGRVWHGEVCNRKKHGGHYWVAATIVPFLDAAGLPVRYIGIRTDITERKAMEVRIQEQLRLVEELIDAIPLPLYMKDTEGRYLRLNRAFEEFVGVRRSDFLGKTISDLLPEESAGIHLEKDVELLRDGGVQSYEAVVRPKARGEYEAIYYKAALTRPDGSISGLVGTIIDITDRKEAERTLRHAMEAAEAANRAKSDFLANMSHEIRTPMNGVIGMTDLALTCQLDDEAREYLQIAKSSADSLLTIINDILDFSKIEAGKLLIETIPFNLHRLVSETARAQALRAHEKGLELILDLDPALPGHVLGDPGRVRQIILNLISNAIKFTRQGEVVVSIAPAPARDMPTGIRFAVRDTGIGIAPDKLQHIFDAFSQEDSSTTRRFGGTGLGLTISQRLVSMLGGRLSVESRAGEGSTFSFTLPLEVATNAHDEIEPRVDLHGLHVLIVDDNRTNQIVLARLFDSWGMVTTSVESAEAALAHLAEEHPLDLIVLDGHMPEMDGFQLAELLQDHSRAAKVPRIMLSSGAIRGDAERCRALGIAAYFPKPVLQQELLAGLHAVLGVGQTGDARSLVTRHTLREAREALRILLVEDHPVNQKLALSLLEKWGHRTTLAQNGQEALDCVAHAGDAFDVILMDVQMPVMGGIEAAQHLRLAGCSSRIIAMTANAMEGDRELCLSAGMDDYIAKPIKSDDLFAKLHRNEVRPGTAQQEVHVSPSFDYLAAARSADAEVVEIVAGLYLESQAADVDALRTALADGDLAGARRLAHTLRGVLGNFKADPAVGIARQIEDACHRHDGEGAQIAFESLLPELVQVEAALRRLAGD